MTTRRWMALVAVVGSILAFGITLHRRAAHFHALADYHEMQGDVLIVNIQPGKLFRQFRFLDVRASDVDRMEARAAWHAQLEEKYRVAAAFPWLPVEPDPPLPK